MKLNEERVQIILVIISTLLIATFALLIQIADSQINNFNNDIQLRYNKVNNIYLQEIKDYNQFFLTSTWMIIYPPNLSYNFNNYSDNSEEFNILHQKYASGNITTRELLFQLENIYLDRYSNDVSDYNQKAIVLNKLITEGTNWSFWKSFFTIGEFIIISLSIAGYFYLYKKITKRIKEKNTAQ